MKPGRNTNGSDVGVSKELNPQRKASALKIYQHGTHRSHLHTHAVLCGQCMHGCNTGEAMTIAMIAVAVSARDPTGKSGPTTKTPWAHRPPRRQVRAG